MAKKPPAPARESWDAAALQAVTRPDAQHPASDEGTQARYIELVGEETLSDDELVELSELAKIIGKTTAQVELDHVIVTEGRRLESLVATEAEAQAADAAAQRDDAAARQAIIDEIFRLQRLLETNGYPECAAYNVARQTTRNIMFARGELESTRRRWPALFGLPADTRRLTSEDLPDAVGSAMTKLGIRI